MSDSLMLKMVIGYFLATPLIKSLFFVIGSKFGGKFREGPANAIVNFFGFSDILLSLVLLLFFYIGLPMSSVDWHLHLGFDMPVSLELGEKSLWFLFLSQLVLSIVGRFSVDYLHKDSYYCKFFSLYFLFQFSTVLIVLSETLSSFLVGWEVLGLTSVFLISFYSERASTVKNSLRVFAIYKLADVALFTAFSILIYKTSGHSIAAIASLSELNLIIFLILVGLATSIKAGVLPVPWLPRAMEGPTPSSAIFYGALATHVPILFLFKVLPHIPDNSTFTFLRILLGIFFFLIAMIISTLARTQPDIKNSLAYSCSTQLSLIFVELFAGFEELALIHLATHSLYRVSQFMRSPSLLFEFHSLEGLRGRVFSETGVHFQYLIPKHWRLAIYKMAYKEWIFIPIVFKAIDRVLLLNRVDRKTEWTRMAVVYSLIWCLFVGIGLFESESILTSMVLLVVPWSIAIISFIVSLSPIRYALLMSLVIVSLFLNIFYVEQNISFYSLLLDQALALVTAVILIAVGRSESRFSRFSWDSMGAFFCLALLWLVGVPGPGTFIFFEKAFHELLKLHYLPIVAIFTLLSLCAISVVRFYSLSFENKKLQRRHHV